MYCLPAQGSAQDTNPLLGSLAHHSQPGDPEGPIPSEGEMDVQPLDTSHSSDLDSNPSDLERIESSASSLSLASEHVQVPYLVTKPPVHVTMQVLHMEAFAFVCNK